jgi:nuclear cap-binding protein subunit 1
MTQLPMKPHIYASLLALVNSKSFDICADVMTLLSEELNRAFADNKWITIKIILCFYAHLVNSNVIVSNSLFSLYRHLLNKVEEPGIKIERADAFVYVVLASLPSVRHC